MENMYKIIDSLLANQDFILFLAFALCLVILRISAFLKRGISAFLKRIKKITLDGIIIIKFSSSEKK